MDNIFGMNVLNSAEEVVDYQAEMLLREFLCWVMWEKLSQVNTLVVHDYEQTIPKIFLF